ncbi:extracellular solute-binding protein [Marispirochaeta sp.]|uniref:extracellular solute-binding protein n=1 Tax=Marispirochaeta sp. TaxID=2038653 RepID=UPI0029C7FAD9|nr:extracellular solute-binding protein [Marispirochaeta sp.]
MNDVDKNNPIPIYHQLKEMIKKKIETGEFTPGSRLPTELELCETFKISRTPVRQALSDLSHEGILYRRPGAGTFISDFSLSPSQDIMRIKVMIPEERWAQTLQDAAAVWNQENPDQQVKLELFTVGHAEFQFKLMHALASGNAPDLSLIDTVGFAQFARDYFILPIDEIDPEWVEETYKQDFFQACVHGSYYNDHIYSIQAQTDMALIWYRKDWFENEGISPPATWDDLIWVSQYFQREEIRKRYRIGPFALGFTAGLKAGETTTHQLLPLLWSTGADIFDDNRVVLDSDGTRRAVEFLSDLVHRYKVASPEVTSNEWDSAMRLFARGETALSFGGSYESGMIKKIAGWSEEEFCRHAGFIPIPAGRNGTQSTNVGGMGYVIYRQAKQPRLALEILKIVTRPKLMREFSVSTNQNPSRISVHKSLNPRQESFLYQTSKFLYQGRMRPILPEYPLVSEQIQAMFENVVSQRLSADVAVVKAAEIISAITRFPMDRDYSAEREDRYYEKARRNN